MEGDFSGQVVLVTGGGKGIGRAIAVELARRGARVAISGRDEAALVSVAKETGALAVQMDVRQEDSESGVPGRGRRPRYPRPNRSAARLFFFVRQELLNAL